MMIGKKTKCAGLSNLNEKMWQKNTYDCEARDPWMNTIVPVMQHLKLITRHNQTFFFHCSQHVRLSHSNRCQCRCQICTQPAFCFKFVFIRKCQYGTLSLQLYFMQSIRLLLLYATVNNFNWVIWKTKTEKYIDQCCIIIKPTDNNW